VRLRGVGATDLTDLVSMRESMFVVQVSRGSSYAPSTTVKASTALSCLSFGQPPSQHARVSALSIFCIMCADTQYVFALCLCLPPPAGVHGWW
jgi:hypothetical protein